MSLTSPYAVYKLDNVNDSSGNSKTLTNNSSATFNTGKIGNAVYLASPAFLSRSDTYFGFPDNWFGSVWVYPTSDTFAGVTGQYDSSSGTERAWLLYHNTGGNIVFHCIAAGPTENSVAAGNGSAPQNTWTHVIFERDRTNSKIRLYINNGAAIENTLSGTTQNQVVTTKPFTIGEYALSNFFGGRIDALEIYPGVSTPTDRSTLYAATGEFPYSNPRLYSTVMVF